MDVILGTMTIGGQDDTTLPALNESSIPSTPQRSLFESFTLSQTPGTPPPGQLDYGLRTPEGVEVVTGCQCG